MAFRQRGGEEAWTAADGLFRTPQVIPHSNHGPTRATSHRWVGTTLRRERSLQLDNCDREVALGAEVSSESDLMEAESVLRRRAFHEAGHCVVGFYRLGLVPLRSTVVP